MNIFDYFKFEHLIKDTIKNDNLEECLKLLGISYFEGSLQEGNENRIVFEFLQTRTMAIEVLPKEQKIRFWGLIGESEIREYFWEYLKNKQSILFDKIIDLLIIKFSLTSEKITFEIVGTCNKNVIASWQGIRY